MQDKRSGLSSGALRSERASEPGAERNISEETRARLIVNFDVIVIRTRAELRALPGVYLHNEEASRRRIALAAKLRRAEKRLRDLRQIRLL